MLEVKKYKKIENTSDPPENRVKSDHATTLREELSSVATLSGESWLHRISEKDESLKHNNLKFFEFLLKLLCYIIILHHSLSLFFIP